MPEAAQSSAATAPGRPFPKGKSGNPGGRPKLPLDVQKLARSYTREAIETLRRALDDEKLCVSAANALLNRAWGMPAQAITGPAGEPLTINLHVDLSGKP